LNKTRQKQPPNTNNLVQVSAERIVITGLVHFGEDVYYDINTIASVDDFSAPENQIIYEVFSDLIVNEKNPKPSIPAILSTIARKYPGAQSEYDIPSYLKTLQNLSVSQEESVAFARKIARLGWARKSVLALQQGIDQVNVVTGDESLATILAAAEGPLLNLANTSLQATDIVDLRTYVNTFLQELIKAEGTLTGISTGLTRLDAAIGGLRFGVHLIGARTKQGKSHLAGQIGDNIASQGTPVLYLDTEMDEQSTLTRRLARLSQVEINDLEGKKFLNKESEKVKVRGAAQKLKELPFYYYNISGKSHEEWISVMRRWIFKTVGFNDDGTAKPCLIILDYIKTMNLGELGDNQEFQYLGQITTDLHNFCRKYHLPILALVQLNRDGLSSSGQGVFAGSDRIAWLCSSLIIFRKKEDVDFADDPPQNGNRKLEVIDCRYGPGLQHGEYINIYADFARSTIKEGRTNIENRSAASVPPIKPVAI